VDVDVDRHNNFNRNVNVDGERYNIDRSSGNRANWEHNAEHRQGVNYRDSATAQKFGGSGESKQVTRDQARGRIEDRPQGGGGGDRQPGSRPGGGERPTQLPSVVRQK
jgi:hypothetical protein